LRPLILAVGTVAALHAGLLHRASAAEVDTSKLKGPLTITADTIIRDNKASTATASGNVVIEYENSILRGQNCVINSSTNKGVMTGEPVLELKKMKVRSTRMDFNLGSGMGSMDNAVGLTTEGIAFTADKAIRLDPRTFRFINGTFTSCDPVDPDWIFKSTKIRFRTEDVAVFRNARFYFKGVPILYTPWWSLPTVTKRKSGFLQPGVGYSSRDGATVQNAYFYAKSDHDDMTLYLDAMHLRGTREGFEYRYVPSSETAGQLNLDFMDDKLANAELWRIDWKNRHRFKNGIRNIAKIERESAISFSKEVTKNVTFNTQRFSDSYIEFNYTKSYMHTSLLGREFQDLKTSAGVSRNKYNRIPEISGDVMPHEILGTPVVAGLKVSATSFSTETSSLPDKLDINRIIVRPSIALPLTPFRGLNILPTLEGRGAWYSRSEQDIDSFSTAYYKADLAMEAPKIFRVFNYKETLFKHSITPRIDYDFVPDLDVDGSDRLKVPLLDNLDESSPKNLLTFALLSRVVMKSTKTQIGREIVRLNITQSFNVNEARRRGGGNRPLSNLNIDLDSRPADWLLLNQFVSWNHYERMPDILQTEVGLKFGNGLYLSYDWTARRLPKTTTHSGVFGYDIARGLSAEVSTIYNETIKDFPSSMISINYRSCCYSISFAASQLSRVKNIPGAGTERVQDTTFQLFINFKGFGEFGQKAIPPVRRKL